MVVVVVEVVVVVVVVVVEVAVVVHLPIHRRRCRYRRRRRRRHHPTRPRRLGRPHTRACSGCRPARPRLVWERCVHLARRLSWARLQRCRRLVVVRVEYRQSRSHRICTCTLDRQDLLAVGYEIVCTSFARAGVLLISCVERLDELRKARST